MPRLVVEKGNDKSKAVVLSPKSTIVFGRDTSAGFQIKDTMASRMHFKIESRADGYWLVDLESMNGTLLNNEPAKEAKLAPGDLIRVGETLFSFLSDDQGTDVLLNQRLGGYKVIERVGRGGMGTVYKAEQVDLQRIVALKIISEEHVKKKDFVELFVHEARAAAKLNHPNIVQVYDVKKHNELYYFSMEFVPGGSVQELLNKQRKVEINTTVRMILDAARGLEYAHKKEIIHRDVKPDNFMVGETGSIKIGDLGLAQRLGEKLSADDEHSVIGTPHYIAPEQVLGRPADYRSDIYALGSTMYRMIAGFTPFQAPSVRELVNKKAREDCTPLHTACPEVPEQLGLVTQKMMARLPEQRYQTMTEVITDLEKYLRDTSGDSQQAAQTASVAVANKRLLMAAVGLLVMVVIGGVIGAIYAMKNPKTQAAQPTSTAGPADMSDVGAEAKLDLAKIQMAKLDPKKVEQVQEAIKTFEVIIEKWPGSRFSEEATRYREELKEKLRGLEAGLRLAALDGLDRNGWNALLQSFQAGHEDLADVDRLIQAYRTFAQEPDSKGTTAATKADLWAQKILEWKVLVEARRAALNNIRAEASRLMGQQKFQQAWELYNRFVTDTLAIKLEQRDRYNTLLYNTIANSLQERIITEAKAQYYKVEEASARAEQDQDFQKAIELFEPVIQDSTSEPRRNATIRRNELWDKWAEAKRRASQLAAEEQKRKEEEDARDFETVSLKWRKSVIKLDARGAADEALRLLQQTAPFPRLGTTSDRLRFRVNELRLLADLKETFLRAWNEQKIPASSRKISINNMTGTLTKVTDTELQISLTTGGSLTLSFQNICESPEDLGRFHAFLRTAVRETDTRWQMGLAILCFEFGQYERALEAIGTLSKMSDEDAKKFVADYKPLADELRYHDCDEIEARKHFDRFEAFMRETETGGVKAVEVADKEMAALNRYSQTRFHRDHKAKIDEMEKLLTSRGGTERQKKLKTSRYESIQKTRSTMNTTIKARELDIYKSIGKIAADNERAYHQGEAWMANRNVKQGSVTLGECIDALLKLVAIKKNPNDPNVGLLSRAASDLMRDYVMLHQPPALIEQLRGRVSAALTENGNEFEVWNKAKMEFDQWLKEYNGLVARHGSGMEKLESIMQDNPEPDAVWTLALGFEGIRFYAEARGLYQALLDNFTDSPQVKSGDALYKLAEVTLKFRDVVEAKKLYSRLVTDYPGHPKSKGRDFDGAEARLKYCSDLENKMQLPK